MPTIRTACCSPAPTPGRFRAAEQSRRRAHADQRADLSASTAWRSPPRPGDKIELKPVTLGRNLGTEVEVVKGLTLNDRVVNSPPDSLAAGDTVRIAGQLRLGVGTVIATCRHPLIFAIARTGLRFCRCT
jgi:hypothetical protein